MWSLQQALHSTLYKIVSPFSEDWPWPAARGMAKVGMPEAGRPGCFFLNWDIIGTYSYK